MSDITNNLVKPMNIENPEVLSADYVFENKAYMQEAMETLVGAASSLREGTAINGCIYPTIIKRENGQEELLHNLRFCIKL